MVIYTSGTTGQPKGTVHVHGGFPIKAAQDLAHTFDLRAGDALCWFTDLGWMMGPWAISGSLLLGSRLVMYEGAPDWPDAGRLWSLVARHRITHFGVSPTLIRALRVHGEAPVRDHDLGSLRVIGSTGEPWNPDPWRWCFDVVGGGRLPIVNYSGGTEIGGGIVGCSLLRPIRPTSFNGPCIGMAADIVDPAGQSIRGAVGELALRAPVAGHDPWLLGRARGRALPRDLLEPAGRHMDPRRLGGDRRGRLLVHPRPVRRHAQGRRQAGRPGGGRGLRRRPSGGRRRGRHRGPRRAQGRGDRRPVRAPAGIGLGRDDRARGRPARRPRPGQAGPPEDRRRGARPATDPERQGHAPGRPRRLARPRPGRHVRPRESIGRRRDQGSRSGRARSLRAPVGRIERFPTRRLHTR